MNIDISEVLEKAVKKSLKKRGISNPKIEEHLIKLIQKVRKTGIKSNELGYFIDAIENESERL